MRGQAPYGARLTPYPRSLRDHPLSPLQWRGERGNVCVADKGERGEATRLPPRRYRLRDTRRIMNECLQGEI